MKVKKDFALKQIANTWVVLPLGAKTVDFTGMLRLNETGRKLWLLLSEGSTREKMAQALVDEYEISFENALADVNEYVEKLVQIGCLDVEETDI